MSLLQNHISTLNLTKGLTLIHVVRCLLLMTPFVSFGQHIKIDTIIYEGNRRTNDYIIGRELTFKKGDSISLQQVGRLFDLNQKRIINTNLFTEAQINLKALDVDNRRGVVHISVKEALYIIGIPLVEIYDSDFNKWWNTYNRSFNYLSYGLKFKHRNLTGNADELDIYAQAGFTKKLALDYFIPYVNSSKTLGLGLSTYHSRNREVAFLTRDNIFQFYRSQKTDQLVRTKVGGIVQYRPELFTKHALHVSYFNFSGTDSLTHDLSQYFFNGYKSLSFVELYYLFEWDRRREVPYALSGHYINGWAMTNLLAPKNAINVSYVAGLAAKYLAICTRWSTEHIVGVRYNLDRDRVPYYFNRGLGSKELYLRGYENYALDGQDYVYIKNSLRYNFFNYKHNWGKMMLLKSYREMPISMYLTANVDVGRVNDRFYESDNAFTNMNLIGYGLGMDLVIYYTSIIRIECSRIHNGDIGVFLHLELGL